jgi:hypothetical protein
LVSKFGRRPLGIADLDSGSVRTKLGGLPGGESEEFSMLL